MALTEHVPDPAPLDAAGVTPIVETDGQKLSRWVLAGVLLFMGVLHVVLPKPFDGIIPRWMPGRPRIWTYAAGLCELSSAALLLSSRTRRFGAFAAAATLVAVYPANIQMAIDHAPNTPLGIALWARLPLQLPMIAWALKHRK